VDEVGIIHMNGRIYDPELGRFLSADPNIQSPLNSQSHNRYSYVWNNPLKYTDPSGYFIKWLKKKVKRFVKKWGRTILAIAAMFIPGAPVFITGFLSGMIASGGDFRAGLIGGLTAGAFDLAGGLFKGTLSNAISHGVIGGIRSKLMGGKFADGFVGGAFGSFANPVGDGFSWAGFAIAVVAGGVGSVLGGGKFANGAVSAAFVHLFGRELRSSRRIRTGGREVDVGDLKSRLSQVGRIAITEPGELRVNYEPGQIVKVYDALVTLADAQGVDFHTDVVFGPEREMLLRAIVGHGDRYTVAWFHHEIAEAMRIDVTAPGAVGSAYVNAQISAHGYVIEHQGNASVFSRYHPSIVNAPEYADQFR
jgi:RHS repeat-associated protein